MSFFEKFESDPTPFVVDGYQLDRSFVVKLWRGVCLDGEISYPGVFRNTVMPLLRHFLCEKAIPKKYILAFPPRLNFPTDKFAQSSAVVNVPTAKEIN